MNVPREDGSNVGLFVLLAGLTGGASSVTQLNLPSTSKAAVHGSDRQLLSDSRSPEPAIQDKESTYCLAEPEMS